MNNMLPRPGFWARTAEECKTRFSMLGELLILMLLYVVSSLVSSLLLSIPMSAWLLGTQGSALLEALLEEGGTQSLLLRMMEQMPDWMSLAALFAAGAMGVAALFYCRKFQKRSLASLGLGKGGAGEYLLGFLAGLVLMGGTTAVGALAGGFSLAAGGPDGSRLGLCALALLGCMVRGASLELLFRGYFAPIVGVRYPTAFALLLSCFASAMLQSGGTVLSMTGLNALLLSLLLGIWVLKRGSLWGACAIQAAWSFGFSFLFDFAPAGEHGSIRLLDVDADTFRPLLTGGEYGPQASICATVVLLAGLALVLGMKGKENFPRPEPEQNEQAPKFL